jgi:hypothetical protein
MPKENDLEGAQDQGGKHGGQKGMPKPEPRPSDGGGNDSDEAPKTGRGTHSGDVEPSAA